MKYVINAACGGFRVPKAVDKELHCGPYALDYEGDIRKDPVLMQWVENHPEDSALVVVEIPDEATDWELDEYDGAEHIVAVVNGKLIHIYE